MILLIGRYPSAEILACRDAGTLRLHPLDSLQFCKDLLLITVPHLFIFRRRGRLGTSLIFDYFSLIPHGFNPGGIHSVPQALVLVLISWGSSTFDGNLRVLEL
jgi:hypothetical protein